MALQAQSYIEKFEDVFVCTIDRISFLLVNFTILCWAYFLNLMPMVIAILVIDATLGFKLINKHRKLLRPDKSSVFAVMVALTLIFMIVLQKLQYIKGVVLPPNSDSIYHYSVIKSLLSTSSAGTFEIFNVLHRYYHIGFHAIVATSVKCFDLPISESILVTGQIFQSLILLQAFSFTKKISTDLIAPWITMIAIGYLFQFPSYATNWGKYPAISGVAGILIVLNLFLGQLQNIQSSDRKRIFSFIFKLFPAIFFAAILTTKSIVILLIIAVSFIFVNKIFQENILHIDGTDLEGAKEILTIILILGNLILFPESELTGMFIFRLFLYLLLIRSYFISFQTGTIASLLTILLSIMSKVSVPYGNATIQLIDPELFTLLITIVAGVLLGLILSIILQQTTKPLDKFAIAFLIVIISLVTFVRSTGQRVDPKYIFGNDSDIYTFDWMSKNIDDHFLIGIAAQGAPGNYYPIDAGGWIEPITDLPTRKLSIDINFEKDLDQLCEDNIRYIYYDNKSGQFDPDTLLSTHPDVVWFYENAILYELNCGNGSS